MISYFKERGKKLPVFENKIIRKIFGRKDMKRQVSGENCIMWSFIITMGMRI